MGEWFKEKLIGVGMAIMVFAGLKMLGDGNAPADLLLFPIFLIGYFLTTAGAFLAAMGLIAFTWLWWLVLPLAALAVVHWSGSTPERLTFTVTRDEDGLPTIAWREPRYESWRWLLKSYTVEARCWLRATPDRWVFCYQVTAPWYRSENSHYCEVLFRSIVGFSVTDADTLYGSGGTRSDELYSQRLVIRADLYPAQNGVALLPMTLTCASRSEVEGLHQTLVEAFGSGALEPAFDLIIARYSQYVPGAAPRGGDRGVPTSIW